MPQLATNSWLDFVSKARQWRPVVHEKVYALSLHRHFRLLFSSPFHLQLIVSSGFPFSPLHNSCLFFRFVSCLPVTFRFLFLPLAVLLPSPSAFFFCFYSHIFFCFISFHFLLSFCWIHLSGPVPRWTLLADLAGPSASDKLTHLWRLPFHCNRVFGNVRASIASYSLLYEAWADAQAKQNPSERTAVSLNPDEKTVVTT